MLFCQVPDPTKVIEAATNAGWAFGLLATVMIAFMLALGWIIKTWMNQAFVREDRMAEEIKGLQTFIQTRLAQVLEANTAATTALREMLGTKPCLWEREREERAQNREIRAQDREETAAERNETIRKGP